MALQQPQSAPEESAFFALVPPPTRFLSPLDEYCMAHTGLYRTEETGFFPLNEARRDYLAARYGMRNGTPDIESLEASARARQALEGTGLAEEVVDAIHELMAARVWNYHHEHLDVRLDAKVYAGSRRQSGEYVGVVFAVRTAAESLPKAAFYFEKPRARPDFWAVRPLPHPDRVVEQLWGEQAGGP